jgi:hypothetical protein
VDRRKRKTPCKQFTVGELKAALKGVPDDLPVYVHTPSPYPEFYVFGAKEVLPSGISNHHFSIGADQEFNW